jgi:hypothetical protein
VGAADGVAAAEGLPVGVTATEGGAGATRAGLGHAVITAVTPASAALPPTPDRSEKSCGQGSPGTVQVTRPAVTL